MASRSGHGRQPEEIATMTKFLTLSALAAALSVAGAADANAWTRQGSATGVRGTATVTATGNCANNTCTRNIVRTGPNGYSTTRQGSASCTGGTCTGSRTTTGPRGKTIVRQGTVTY
jgi:hypothetical protein